MTDEELGKAIWKKIGSLYFEATLGAAARELLATMPAPEVDPDAEVKALAWEWHIGVNNGNNPNTHQDANAYWDMMLEPTRNGWRAVAAKKEAGGE